MSATKSLNILITAGATTVYIDKVRKIANTSSGKTGEKIARHLMMLGHNVTLLTSADIQKSGHWVHPFETYDELMERMEFLITRCAFDVIIHAAAVPDYKPEGMYQMTLNGLESIQQSGKISSKHPELFLRLIPTLKIIDLIRYQWGFSGTLIKFKLEVDCADAELINIARTSMRHSMADYIVANCLEWAEDRAIILSEDQQIDIRRDLLPLELGKLLAGKPDDGGVADREKICKAIDESNSNEAIYRRVADLDISEEERTRARKIINGYWCCSKDLKSIIMTGERICT